MRMSAACVLGCAVLISACGQQAADTTGPAVAGNRGAAAPSAPPTDDRAALARERAQTARMLSAQLPLRQKSAQGIVTISGIEANGTEMIHRIEVPANLDATNFEQFRAQLPARMCEDSSVRQTLLRGGSNTYVFRDKDGEEFTATIDRC